MGLKSTIDRYGSMAVSIHWLSAILVLVLIVLGFRAAGTVDPVAKAAFLRLHLPIGIAVLALTVLRIVWWWRFDRKPDPTSGSHAGKSVPVRRCMYCFMSPYSASSQAASA